MRMWRSVWRNPNPMRSFEMRNEINSRAACDGPGDGGIRPAHCSEQDRTAPARSPPKGPLTLLDGKSLQGWDIVKGYDYEEKGKVDVQEWMPGHRDG